MKRVVLSTALWAWALPAQTPGYQPFAEVEKRLAALAQANPQLVKRETMGRSAGGRGIYALEIAAPGPVDPSRRPAVFVGANIVGYHNAGTQAALALAETLVSGKDGKLLASRTFYIAPALNPDAMDGMFGAVRQRMSNNGAKLDRDRDGLVGEDGPDDLNQDGRITQMRIADPAGTYLPDPAGARLMIQADPLKGQRGLYLLVTEGADDDRDGQYNEDPPGGYRPDKNFAHAWNDADPESGVFPGAAPEARAVMDYLLKRRNVALALVYGPANNLLEMPRGAGAAVDAGQMRVRPPQQFQQQFGLENREYTVDEIFELVKDTPLARQAPGGLTREMLASFLGAGPATSPAPEDLRYYENLAADYRKNLDAAGLDGQRSGRQSQTGGLQNWLYYHYGVLAIELDVWGIPRRKAEPAKPGAAEPLSMERLEKMSNDEFLALGEEKIAAWLKEVQAPPVATAPMLMEGVKSGKMTPARLAGMIRQAGAGGARTAGPGAAASADSADLLDYIDKNAPTAFTAWTPVTLPDGTKAEVGGPDPFVEIAPPEAELKKAAEAHANAVLQFAGRTAQVAIAAGEAKEIGGGVWRVSATAVNTGFLPTHTSHGARTRAWLPVRLEIGLPAGAALVSGNNRATSERLVAGRDALKGEWLVRAGRGAKITLELHSQNAGADRREVVLQ
jgi:hypothetical protein